MFPELPFCKTPKKSQSSFITVSHKEQYFFTKLYGLPFLGFLCLCHKFHTENSNNQNLLTSLLLIKMKGVVSHAYPLCEDQRARLKHQSLLQDYEDLQKETNGMRIRLKAAKQKKLILADEVRFLRERYRYLMKNPSPKPQPKQDVSHLLKLKTQAPILSKGRNYYRKESTLRPPVASHLSTKERISNGVDITLQKPAHMFDLNQSARSLSIQNPSFLSSAAALELNHKDRIHDGKEAGKKSVIPVFDLNQISTEEEELLGSIEPLRIEESKRMTQRGLSEEQHNDIKLSVCRNIGNGSNRTVKRKISWQDQVALRV